MRWVVAVLIAGCARSEPRITSEPASCCVSSASAKPSATVADTPEACEQLLFAAMRAGDEAAIERYTTAKGRASIYDRIKGEERVVALKRWGKGWAEWETRWRKKTEDRAEAVMGPESKEHGLTFIRENGAWKLDRWQPGE
jgi:hypothetical protein